MSAIITNFTIPKSCGGCKMSATDVCTEWMWMKRKELGEKRADTCPVKSIEGLIKEVGSLHTVENSEGQDYVQMYDVLQAIKDYCEVD